MNSPYTSQFINKNRRKKYIISLSILTIIAIVLAYIMIFNNNSSSKLQNSKVINIKKSKNSNRLKIKPGYDENYISEETDESEGWDKKIDEAIEKINQKAEEERKRKNLVNNDSMLHNKSKEIVDSNDVKQDKPAKNKPDKIIVDLLRKCRYSFTTKYQMRGGVDILVMDTYTGELRIKRNFRQDAPLKLFTNDNTASGKRRFFELVSYQLEGGYDIYIIDSFTGEVRGVKKIIQETSLKLFEEFENKGYIRYVANLWYRDGGIDFLVMDDCTSEIKMKMGLIKETSISLFQNETPKKFSYPRYSFWMESYQDRIDCFTIDTFTSVIKIKKKINQLENIKMFDKNNSKISKPRYSAWNEKVDGFDILFVFDAYKCQLKKVKRLLNKSEIQLFKNNSDNDAWMRYRTFISYANDYIEINGFDSVTGVLIIKTISDFDEIRLFENIKKADPKNSRYEISIQRGIYDNKLEIYVMDRYTSEIRRHIKSFNEKEVKLF